MNVPGPKNPAPADPRDYPRRFYGLGREALVIMRPPGPGGTPHESVYSLASLETRTRSEPVLPLGALIFHCSRCGSTLLARLFELDPANRVFDEPDPLLKFFAASSRHPQDPAEARGELRAFVHSFGLAPQAGEKRVIIKLHSKLLLHLPALRACFPDVPFIYLLRNPVEVVASLCALPPTFLCHEDRAPLAAAFGDSPENISSLTPARWFSWYVDRNLRLALEHAHEFSEVIDYQDFTTRYLDVVNRISHTRFSNDMPEVARTWSRHSKNPQQAYSGLEPRNRDPDLIRTVNPITAEAYQLWQGQIKKNAP